MYAVLVKTVTAFPILLVFCLFEMGYLLSARQPSGDNLSGEGGMVLFYLCVCIYSLSVIFILISLVS